jgi:hypothetical protein
MAITIEDQPYTWSARGQKLMIVASSTETAQDGFQYGVTVTNNTTTQVFNFYISPAIDGRLYFDLQSLIQLRNEEAQGTQLHNLDTGTLEDVKARDSFSFSVAEWWIVGGILTEEDGSSVLGDDVLIVNQYYQPTDGYKPNPNSGPQNVKFAMTNASSLVMSDRPITTKYPPIFATWGVAAGKVAIAVREQDYGLLYVPGNDFWLGSNEAHSATVTMFPASGFGVASDIVLNNYSVEGLPVFPANLNDRTGVFLPRPSLFPNWRYYRVRINNTSSVQVSADYIFWNECVYGNCECNWPNVRLAWVGARGGYEYFNFKKKSEYTTEVDRKIYKRPLFNNSPTIFYANDRGLNQRTNLAQRILTVTSDYITQEEFIYLRGLIVSNQVHLIDDNGSYVAVNIDDTSYVEKRTYDGKLYNLTLKVRMANEYWT